MYTTLLLCMKTYNMCYPFCLSQFTIICYNNPVWGLKHSIAADNHAMSTGSYWPVNSQEAMVCRQDANSSTRYRNHLGTSHVVLYPVIIHKSYVFYLLCTHPQTPEIIPTRTEDGERKRRTGMEKYKNPHNMRSTYEHVEYSHGTANPTPLVQALKMMHSGTECESRRTGKKTITNAEERQN